VAMTRSRPPKTKWERDFAKAIGQLLRPYAVVTWYEKGYTLVSTVKSIVASYMQAAQPEQYKKALTTAAEVFDWVAEKYFADSPQAGEQYVHAARSYRQRLEMEAHHGTTD
jgi:hypothetical protein